MTIDAIIHATRLEGMITDPVYESKSMASLIDLCRKKAFEPKSKILYVNLGGAPAINAYSMLF